MKKKIFAVLLTASMVLSMGACGQTKTDESTSPAEETTAASGSAETTGAEEEDDYFSVFMYDDVSAFVELGEYKGIHVPEQMRDVTPADVEEALEGYLEEYNSYSPRYEEIKDRTVQEGDTVNLDYSGMLDGETEPFQGGTAQGQSLKIGSGQFIDGFEAGLVGVEIGKEVKLDLSFPEDYGSEDLAGKKVVFTCTVNYIQGEVIPYEMDDEFASLYTNGECENVIELRAYAENALIESKESEAMNNILSEAWARILQNCTFKETPVELEEYLFKQQKNDLLSSISMYGYSLEDYLEMISTEEEPYDEARLDEELHAYTLSMANSQTALYAVLKAEGMLLDEAGMDTALEDFAGTLGASVDELSAYYGRNYLEEIVYQNLMQDWLVSNSLEDPSVEPLN